WFTPNVDDSGRPLDRDGEPLAPRGAARRLYCDDRYLEGYRGVVDWFATRAAAKAALRELQQAVRTIARPPQTSDVDDPVNVAHLEALAAEDAGRAKFARLTPRRDRLADPFS